MRSPKSQPSKNQLCVSKVVSTMHQPKKNFFHSFWTWDIKDWDTSHTQTLSKKINNKEKIILSWFARIWRCLALWRSLCCDWLVWWNALSVTISGFYLRPVNSTLCLLFRHSELLQPPNSASTSSHLLEQYKQRQTWENWGFIYPNP